MFSHHYSCAHDPETLFEKAEFIAKRIDEIVKKEECIPFYCYTGMSGVALYTALSFFHDSEQKYAGAYVRKQGENTHGRPIEYFYNRLPIRDPFKIRANRYFRIFFIDDLICTGKTMSIVINTILDDLGPKQSPFRTKHFYSCLFDNDGGKNIPFNDHSNPVRMLALPSRD